VYVRRCSLLLPTGQGGGLSVCVSVCHTSKPAKMAKPIEMPFGLRTLVGPGNHVLYGGPDPLMGNGNFLTEGVPL